MILLQQLKRLYINYIPYCISNINVPFAILTKVCPDSKIWLSDKEICEKPNSVSLPKVCLPYPSTNIIPFLADLKGMTSPKYTSLFLSLLLVSVLCSNLMLPLPKFNDNLS